MLWSEIRTDYSDKWLVVYGKYKFYLFYFLLFLVLLLFIEVTAYLTCNFLSKYAVFYNPSLIKQDYLDYLSKRDIILGWPNRSIFGLNDEYDYDGGRISPAYSSKFKPCISLYGDSFTWSEEVDNDHAWGNILSIFIKCRVANYGVVGYGTDQAFLRFKNNDKDTSNIVVLNHLSENIIRNINQFRFFIFPGKEYSFKPRFILNPDKTISLIDTPNIKYEEINLFLKHPEKFLKHEYFLPGDQAGIGTIKFPYSLSLIKAVVSNYELIAKLHGYPRYMEFYDPEHHSQGLYITIGIFDEFVHEAEARQKLPIISIIPTCRDLIYYQKNKVWPYKNLLDLAREKGYPMFVNTGDYFIKKLGTENPKKLFNSCSGHFNEIGYKMLAEIMLEFINEKKVIEGSNFSRRSLYGVELAKRNPGSSP